MTTRQFLMALDELAHQQDKSDVPARAAELLVEAFREGIDILIGCQIDDEKNISQLYSYDTSPDKDRELLCYTNRDIADDDPQIPDWHRYPVRSMLLNAVTRDVYVGLVFNQNEPGLSFSVPKELFSKQVNEMVCSVPYEGNKTNDGDRAAHRLVSMDIPEHGPLEGATFHSPVERGC